MELKIPTREEFRAFYQTDLTEAFPEEELKPLSAMEFLWDKGVYRPWCLYEDEKIIGCGGIGPYWGSETESALFNIFVLPEFQGKGVGRKLIETLEADEYALRAKRIEIAASITARDFYLKLGYTFKTGNDALDDEQLYRLEKFRI